MIDLLLRGFCMKQAEGLGGGLIAAAILSYLTQWPVGVGSQHVVENIADFFNAPAEDVEGELKALVNAGAIKVIEGPLGPAYEYNREV